MSNDFFQWCLVEERTDKSFTGYADSLDEAMFAVEAALNQHAHYEDADDVYRLTVFDDEGITLYEAAYSLEPEI